MDRNIKNILILWFSFIFSVMLVILAASLTVKADDPNLSMPCNSESLPTKQNVQDIKAIMKEIRTIAAHSDMVYIRLHDKERENIKKRLPYEPHLELFLK